MFWLLVNLIASVGFAIAFCIWIGEDIKNDERPIYMLLDVFGLVLSVLCACGCISCIIDKPQKYKSSEYRIETEITTRGNVSDTTYVIIKK